MGVWEEWETHPLAGSLALLDGCSVGRENMLDPEPLRSGGLTSESQFGVWGSVEGAIHTLLPTFDGQMLMILPTIDQKQINNSAWPENGRKVLKCY